MLFPLCVSMCKSLILVILSEVSTEQRHIFKDLISKHRHILRHRSTVKAITRCLNWLSIYANQVEKPKKPVFKVKKNSNNGK
jgi:hypothetical protein